MLKNVLKFFQMSEKYWGCLDKMFKVNFSPAETLGNKLFHKYSLLFDPYLSQIEFDLHVGGCVVLSKMGFQGFTVFQFEAVTVFDRSTVLKSHQAEQSSFASHMVMMLNLLQSVMRQYDR